MTCQSQTVRSVVQSALSLEVSEPLSHRLATHFADAVAGQTHWQAAALAGGPGTRGWAVLGPSPDPLAG